MCIERGVTGNSGRLPVLTTDLLEHTIERPGIKLSRRAHWLSDMFFAFHDGDSSPLIPEAVSLSELHPLPETYGECQISENT